MKKYLVALLMGLMFCSIASAETRLTGSYDYYMTSSAGPNSTDGKGFSLGVQHDIVGNLDGKVEFSYITDIDFPEARDPKGSWGELRGYGFFYNLIYELPVTDWLGFEIGAGAGYFFWDFRENPWLQDRNIKVDVDGAFAGKLYGGVHVKPIKDWTLDVTTGWFDSNPHKKVRENAYGIDNILGADDEIGLQFRPIWFEFKHEF